MSRPLAASSLALALALAACAPTHDAPLLELGDVGPTKLTAGRSLTIEGKSFPQQAEAVVRFEGLARNPGRRPVTIDHEARAHVAADGTLRLKVDRALFEAMGGRATFDGDLRVSFPSAAGGPNVYGRVRGVRLDFLPDTGSQLGLELERARRGREVARRLGLVLSEEEGLDEGLAIASVVEGGVAARLGMAAGDRIVAMDGLYLHAITDFLPPPGIEATVLEVDPVGPERRDEVTLPLFVASDLPTPAERWWVAVAGVLLLALFFTAPTARLTAALSTKPPASTEGTFSWLIGASSRSPRTRGERLMLRLLTVLGFLVVSLAFAGVAVSGTVLESGFGVGILLTSSLALRLTARVMDDAPLELSMKLLGVAVVGAPLSIAVICICLLVGTGHLGEIHDAQGGLPWQWLVFHHPVAFALFPVFAATALGRIDADRGASAVAARGHLLVVSCLGASIFLGGWNPPFVDVEGAATWGVVAFMAKCWLLVAAGLWARRMGPGAGEGVWRWAVPMSLAGLGSSLLWLAADVPAFVELSSGPLLAGVTGAAALYVAYGRLSRRVDTLRLYPFL